MKIDHKDSFPDFGNQFIKDSNIDGYWGSVELLKDIVSPFNLSDIKDKIIMEIGVGSGRISNNLLKFNPKFLYGVEPSKAIDVAKKNIKSDKIEFINCKGEDLKFLNEIDYVFSLGVIHHIPNYEKVLEKIYASLKPGGKFIIWVYGKEGNELYLLIFNNLRRITIYLPDFILRVISHILNLLTYVYGFFCKFFNLPLRKYFIELFNKCSFQKRSYIIFDQLNPSYAKYFTKNELNDVLKKSNFINIKINNRHGYSHTAIAEKQ
jgi:SAM-dependent methyltransferase